MFICYRREDSAGHTGRLHDHLIGRYGSDNVFVDIATLEPGLDFVDAIHDALSRSDVFLAIIGRNWIDAKDGRGDRRLNDPDDFVRLELQAALDRDMRVIPVLVQDARMPLARELPDDLRALARRNALELSDKRWNYDIEQLTSAIDRVIASRPRRGPTRTPEVRPTILSDSKPATNDVVIVAARAALPQYLEDRVYLCQPGRRFRSGIRRVGFYTGHLIHQWFPLILAHRDLVPMNEQEVARLVASRDSKDQLIGRHLEPLVKRGHRGDDGFNQVFVLSARDDPQTLMINKPIRNSKRDKSGKAVAWTFGQRYVSSQTLLRNPETTDELGEGAQTGT